MKKLKTIVTLVGLMVTLPIAIWLQFKIMERVQATDLMWFVFWLNLPLNILVQVIFKLAE
jgi:hypothetical protein